jgi:hypothetical protein
MANEITGNVNIALIAFLLVWTFAAFGEEIAYRGYLLTRAAGWNAIRGGLLDRGCPRFDFVWVRALLQRRIWRDRLRRGRTNSRKRLYARRSQPVGQHFCSRIH